MSANVHYFRCSVCSVTYSVSVRDPDILLVMGKVTPCPNHPCTGKVTHLASGNTKMQAVKVKAIELYQAHQMGFKAERKCGPADLAKLLTGATVLRADIDKSADPNKSIIRSITLKGGKTIHLAPSTYGVVVIKVTEGRDVR